MCIALCGHPSAKTRQKEPGNTCFDDWRRARAVFFLSHGWATSSPSASVEHRIKNHRCTSADRLFFLSTRERLFFISKTAAAAVASVFTGDLPSHFIMRSIRAADDNIIFQRPSVNGLLFFRRVFTTFLPAKNNSLIVFEKTHNTIFIFMY